jgi:hypothetical protein
VCVSCERQLQAASHHVDPWVTWGRSGKLGRSSSACRPSLLVAAVSAVSQRPESCCPAVLLLQVLDFELQKQLVPYMKEVVPLPGESSSSNSSSSSSRSVLVPTVSAAAFVTTVCRMHAQNGVYRHMW